MWLAARSRGCYPRSMARAEVARLGEAVKELAVKLTLVEGKGRWG
jgi:hypothetical protein